MRASWRTLTYAILSTTFVLLLSACGLVINDPGLFGGSDAATVTIQLTGPASVMLGAQSQYSAKVSGASDGSVTWSVNGIAGGNPQTGSISSTGLYIAPAAAPQSGSVTITATSVAKPTVSQSLPVTLSTPPPSSNTGGTGPTVSLTLSGPVTVTLGSSAQYTASITGSSNAGVSWSVNGVPGGNASVGQITTAGLYTAPAAAPASPSVTITATSLADSTVSQSLAITLQAPVPPSGGGSSVTVAVSGPSTVLLGASAQYTAVVTGSANTGVAWSVNGVPGGSSGVGFITAAGLYTAPASAPQSSIVTITATSLADPSVSQGLSVTLTAPPPPPPPPPSSVSLTLTGPSSVMLGATAQYTAVVSGSSNMQVSWSVNGVTGGNASLGTISANGLYSAPAVAPRSSSVTIGATSVADPTVSQTLSVTLTAPPPPPPPVTLTLSGARNVLLGGTSQYTATVSGTSNKQVRWSVNGVPGGDSSHGSISAAGLYRAPAVAPKSSSITIAATSVVDPTASQGLSVTLTSPAPPPPVTLTLSGARNVLLGTTSQYTATVSGSSNQQVTWSVSGIVGGSSALGSISANGLYKAPATMPRSSAVTITATSAADSTVSQSLVVTLASPPTPPPSGPTISLSGATTVMLGATAQYSAVVTGSSDTAVTWSVDGIVGGNASVGTISAAGLYTAPGSVPSSSSKITITATSQADSSVSQSLTVTLTTPPTPPQITVTLSGATSVALNASSQYTATVTGSSNTNVTWSVNGVVGGETSIGTISPSGRYTAPGTMPQAARVTITATSLADSTVSQNLTVTLTSPPPPTVTVTVSGATKLTLGSSTQYTATVTGSSNTGVIWSVNGVTGGNGTNGSISANGLYTAPTVAPQPSTVTITATSTADNSAASSLVVTLTAPTSRIPANAIASADLNSSTRWSWNHDAGTPGSSQGSSTYPVSGMSDDNAARQFYMTYSGRGGEIYHLSFANDKNATHFVYDTYVYVVDPSQLANLEMDMNDVTADGRTMILGTQCSTYSKSWEYTLYTSGGFHWHPSNIPCDPTQWSANTWHHIQIASHRDNSGNATYDWVSVDGKYSDFAGASGPDSASLGWAIGTLLINFQIDGYNKTSGSNTLYTDKFIVWRW